MRPDGTSRCDSLCKAAGAGLLDPHCRRGDHGVSRESTPPNNGGQRSPKPDPAGMRHGRQSATPYAYRPAESPPTTGEDDDRPQGRQTQQDRAWTQAQRRTDNLPPEKPRDER